MMMKWKARPVDSVVGLIIIVPPSHYFIMTASNWQQAEFRGTGAPLALWLAISVVRPHVSNRRVDSALLLSFVFLSPFPSRVFRVEFSETVTKRREGSSL
jgi:hypothetical protein